MTIADWAPRHVRPYVEAVFAAGLGPLLACFTGEHVGRQPA
jgi:hypothetical protein